MFRINVGAVCHVPVARSTTSVMTVSRLGPIKTVWWFIISLGAMTGLLFNLTFLTQNYMAYNVNVNIQVIHATQQVFPSITVCNMSPLKKSALLNDTAGSTGSPTKGTTDTGQATTVVTTAPSTSVVAAGKRRRKRAAGPGEKSSFGTLW